MQFSQKGRQGLQFVETLKQAEKELCHAVDGLFGTLNKILLQCKEMIKSMQYSKLSGQVAKCRIIDRNVWNGSGRIQL